MKVPDKIYVSITYPLNEEFIEMIGFEFKDNDDNVEYIRKDAILSLLNQKRCSCSDMPPTQFFQGEMYGLQEAMQIVKDL